MWFLTFTSTLNAMKYFTNKKFIWLCTGNCTLCHQIYSCLWTFIWKTLFALLSNTGLSPTPWATPDFFSTVVDSYRQPDKSHGVLFRLRAFSRAMEAPQKLGEFIPPGTHSSKGGRSKLINGPVLRGTVLRLLLQGSSTTTAHSGNCFLLSFLHSMPHTPRPLTATSFQVICLH